MSLCADIAINDGIEYVYNGIEVAEDSYDFLRGIWAQFYPGRRIQWISELDPATGFERPVWIDWTKEPDGWHPPMDMQSGN